MSRLRLSYSNLAFASLPDLALVSERYVVECPEAHLEEPHGVDERVTRRVKRHIAQ